MTTFTALTLLDDKSHAEALGEALENLDPAPTGIGVFALEDGSALWEVGAYFEETPDRAGLMLLSALHKARDFIVSELPDTDWVAHVKRELHPVRAGRFFVHGSHDAEAVPDRVEPLLIEASMAFGTGHHGTTLGCLLALEAYACEVKDAPRVVLDLGCGTAVLAMAAARSFPQARVLASDIDPVAIDVAEVNLTANHLSERVTTHVAAGLDDPKIAQATPFDLVFANILKGPLIALAPTILTALSPHGCVILSGILATQVDEVRDVYSAGGNNVEIASEIGDWATLRVWKRG
ncbi:MAG: 50S ribosomal protein L11 methyltransferase [Pseudomonadota bacterium]